MKIRYNVQYDTITKELRINEKTIGVFNYKKASLKTAEHLIQLIRRHEVEKLLDIN